MKRLYLLTICSICLAVCIFALKKRTPTTISAGKGPVVPKDWLQTNKNPHTPQADLRPADQTFLTYPEWFLVFSPEEQANYFEHHTATSFPYMSHTAQIWESYKIVNDQIKDDFPTNTGYHFMIWVIGSSASVEYAIKSAYETLIGRLTDTKRTETEEDLFNAQFTRDYVDFIKERPWYEFDFKSRLRRLWSNTSILGDNLLRKLERRYILSSELLVKYAYGKLIGLGTRQMYEVALPTTALVLENDSVQYLPRYDRFAPAVMKLAVAGHSFKEIAGNNSAILLSVLVPVNYKPKFDNSQVVFIQPISSDTSLTRIVLATPVRQLSGVLREMHHRKIKIEHVFDF
jgi:hypothetical protein